MLHLPHPQSFLIFLRTYRHHFCQIRYRLFGRGPSIEERDDLANISTLFNEHMLHKSKHEARVSSQVWTESLAQQPNYKIHWSFHPALQSCSLFNPVTPSLTLQSKFPTGSNPSWITLDSNNRNVLYATNENSAGALQSFLINPNGTLYKVIDTISSGGDSPAFATALSTGAVAVVNYGSGNGRIIPTTSKGETFQESNRPSPSLHLQVALRTLIWYWNIRMKSLSLIWVQTRFGASGSARMAVAIKFKGQFPSQREAGRGISPFTV